MNKALLVAILGGLAGLVGCGAGGSLPPTPESGAEENGLRLVLELAEDQYVPDEFGAATLALVNERDSSVKITGQTCAHDFGLWVMDHEEEVVFSWADYWVETELGYGQHICRDETHTLEPGESLRHEVGFVIPEVGEFKILAVVEMWEGEQSLRGPRIPLSVEGVVKVSGP